MRGSLGRAVILCLPSRKFNRFFTGRWFLPLSGSEYVCVEKNGRLEFFFHFRRWLISLGLTLGNIFNSLG